MSIEQRTKNKFNNMASAASNVLHLIGGEFTINEALAILEMVKAHLKDLDSRTVNK